MSVLWAPKTWTMVGFNNTAALSLQAQGAHNKNLRPFSGVFSKDAWKGLWGQSQTFV